jgi:hypothetical protein
MKLINIIYLLIVIYKCERLKHVFGSGSISNLKNICYDSFNSKLSPIPFRSILENPLSKSISDPPLNSTS